MNIKFITDIINLLKTRFRATQQAPESELVIHRKRYVTIDEIYAKHYGAIDYSIFCEIVRADPTYSSDNPDKMGKYGKWLLSLYQKGALLTEDLYKAHDYLDCFNRFRRRLAGSRDINQIKSLPDLYDLIKDFLDIPEEIVNETTNEEQRIKENEARRLYEDKDWLVIQPLTQQAAIIYGRGTQWCTSATRSYNYFERYNSQGPLFILISKKHNRKYQFHFESKTYCDETDRSIMSPIAETIDMTIGLAQFYQNHSWYDLFKLNQNGFHLEGNRFIKLEDCYCYFNSNGKIIEGISADNVVRYTWGNTALYLIYRNKKWNLIWASEENTIFPEWNDEIKMLSRGIVIATNNGKQRVYSLYVEMFFEEFLKQNVCSFETICNVFASFTSKDRLTDLSVIDKLVFEQAEEPKDYLEYLKIFGSSALHKKLARYKVAIPFIKSVAAMVFIVGTVCTAIGFSGGGRALGEIGVIAAVIGLAILGIAKFTQKFVDNLINSITFLAVSGSLMYILIEFGPTVFLSCIAVVIVLLLVCSKVYSYFKLKKK